jgi:hypothetical protein
MSVKSRLEKIEKVKNEAYKAPIICFTDVYENRMSIGKPIDFEGTIKECEDIVKKRNLNVINIIDDVPRPGYRVKEWCL